MTISETKQLIISKTISDYEKFDKASISLRDISFSLNSRGETFVSYVLQSSYYDLDNNIINKETNLNSLISNDIKQLLLAISKEQKINKGMLTIYPNGEYESSFIWDEQADKEYRLTGLFGGLDYLGNTFFVEHFFLNKLEWENMAGNIVITIHISTSIQTTAVIESGDIKTKEVIEFPDYIEEGLKNIHYQTNEGDLKGMLSPWNTIILCISNSDSFDVNRDVKFEWREDLA